MDTNDMQQGPAKFELKDIVTRDLLSQSENTSQELCRFELKAPLLWKRK